ncbi:hypothetical protein BDV93DRAFT_524207 [Ceratobasidium sp. AG-I]|nr:hypothetical protein BDV93DRAFT_524207 [Ceratobasidium sp. AG-I]
MEKSLAIPHMSDQTWLEHLASARVEVQKAVQLTVKEFNRRWGIFSSWVSQPHIRYSIIAGVGILTLAAIFFGVPALGFGASGIIAGSWAAGFQGAVYAGATPAAGWFAYLTSAAMTGLVPQLAMKGALATTAGSWAVTQLLGLNNQTQVHKSE